MKPPIPASRLVPLIAVPLALANLFMALAALVLLADRGIDLAAGSGNAMVGPVLGVTFSLVGAVVALRRAGNPIGWIFLLIAFSQSLAEFANQYVLYHLDHPEAGLALVPELMVLGTAAWMPGFALLLTYALLLFPDGRLPSPAWRPVAWLCALPLALFGLLLARIWPHRGEGFWNDPDQYLATGIDRLAVNAFFPLALVCGLCCVASLVTRFVRSRGLERQQLKWVAFAAAVTLTGVLVTESLPLPPAAMTASQVLVPSIPVAAAFAILRYRLFDIDLIINRAMVYALLTAALGAVYFGSVLSLQALLRALAGGESQLAVVVSTLVVAALFTPFRRRLQGVIDRAFYRRQYDARLTLEQLGARLRDEVELEPLADAVLGSIDAALQPSRLSRWLRREGRG